jgi:hypothetical protein
MDAGQSDAINKGVARARGEWVIHNGAKVSRYRSLSQFAALYRVLRNCESPVPGSESGGELVVGNNREAGRRNRNESLSAFTVEVEYGATEGAGERPPRAHESVCNVPEVRGISTESQRRERAVEILAEAVYSYLRKRGQLTARARQTARSTSESEPSSGGKILDESLDFQA